MSRVPPGPTTVADPARREFLIRSSLVLLAPALSACGGEGASKSDAITVVAGSLPPLSTTVTQPLAQASSSAGPRRLALWGDSRTQGQGSTASQSFSAFLSAYLPSITIVNEGMAGQTAAQIMARQGSVPTLLTIEGGRLPASGPVTVNGASENIFFYPHSGGPTSFSGSILGVSGLYSSPAADGRGTFTRAVAGEIVGLDGAVPFLTDIGESLRDADIFFCGGENEIGYLPAAQIATSTLQVASRQTTADHRYIVAGIMPDRDVPTSSGQRERWDALNSLLQRLHGDHYLDLASPPTSAELAEIGYVTTSGDRADIANGLFPAGMFADTKHLNGQGQKVWAIRVRDFYTKHGWR